MEVEIGKIKKIILLRKHHHGISGYQVSVRCVLGKRGGEGKWKRTGSEWEITPDGIVGKRAGGGISCWGGIRAYAGNFRNGGHGLGL